MLNRSVSPLSMTLLWCFCLTLVCLPPSPARTADGTHEVTNVEEAFEFAYSSSTSNRRRRGGTSPVRFNLSIGGGLNVGSQWIDYTVDSNYIVPEQGLVDDEESYAFHFIAKPVLDIQVGVELAQERLVLGFHVGVTGISQRSDATMTAVWGEAYQPPETVLAEEENTYNPPMVLIGFSGAWVFLPDKLFTPIAGMRLGVGITYDGDYHMIDSWKAWYNRYVETGEFSAPDPESSFSFKTRVPFRAGADLGVRWNAHEKFGVELHVPLEIFAMHGYIRGILTGLNARFVLRL